MAKGVNMGRGTEENQKIVDFWEFRKEFFVPEDNDEFWEEVIKAGNALIKKYNNEKYVLGLVKTHIDDLEERYKNAKKKVQ